MTILYADHLILDVRENAVGQWIMIVSNNGVVIGDTYGPTPVPQPDVLRAKARRIAAQLPQNVWGY